MSREPDEPTSTEALAELLDELAGQANAVLGQELLLEVAEQARAEYATVTLASRLMATLGAEVTMQVAGIGTVAGRLERCAATWCHLDAGTRQWLVVQDHLVAVDGVNPRSVPEGAWPATARLGLGSALRRLADDGRSAHLHLSDGTRLEVRWGRVGNDFVEVYVGERRAPRLVAHAAIVAVAH